MLLEVSSIYTNIQTDNPELLDKLIELYSFNDPKAFYAKKKRFYDTRKYFISKKGRILTGLVPRLQETLKEVNLIPKIEYKQKVKEFSIPKEIKLDNWTFRDYQVELLEKALKAKRGIVKSATGSGKTSLMAFLISAFKDQNVIVLFNQKQLLVQCYEFLTKQLGMKNIGLAFGEGYIPSNVMLCTVQSLHKIVGTPAEKPDLLIVDEVHEFGSGGFNTKVIHSFPSASYRFGFTATVPSDNIKLFNIEGAFGPVISSISTQELISEGYLAKPHIKVINVNFDPSSLINLEYKTAYQNLIVTNSIRNNLIKTICESIDHPSPKIAIITQSLEHTKILKDLIPNSVKIEGSDCIADRQDAIAWFRKTYKPVLIGTKILQTGVDIKEITHLIIARGLKSDIPTIQALGRSLRVDKDTDVFVYDFYDRDGAILEKHSRSRIRAYKQEGHKPEII